MEQCSQKERITGLLREGYGAEPEHLWPRYPNYMVFRHPLTKKWFAAIMDVPRNRLGLEGTEPAGILNIKCTPLLTGALLSQAGFLPAYHMNKNAWVSILLDGTVPDGQILPLVELSYAAVAPRARRKSSNIK